MTAQQQTRVASGSDGPRDDDVIAEDIVGKLNLDPSIEKSRAVNEVKNCIKSLRKAVRADAAEPWESDAKEAVKQIANHAAKLAVGIEKLSPKWRWLLSLSAFHKRDQNGAVIVGLGSERTAEIMMSRWLSDLKRITRDFGRMQDSPSDFFAGAKKLCAFEAAKLIHSLSPTTKLTTGDSSTYCAVAETLWGAVAANKSMRRACDGWIDAFRKIESKTPVGD